MPVKGKAFVLALCATPWTQFVGRCVPPKVNVPILLQELPETDLRENGSGLPPYEGEDERDRQHRNERAQEEERSEEPLLDLRLARHELKVAARVRCVVRGAHLPPPALTGTNPASTTTPFWTSSERT